MALEKIRKQEWETFYIAGSILNVQNATETVVLSTSTVVAEDKDGLDVSATFLEQATKKLDSDTDGVYSDNMLAIRIRAGDEDLSPYKVTFKIITTEDNQFEIDSEVEVRND